MSKLMLRFVSKVCITLLFILGLIELGFALWTILDQRYKTLAYSLADIGYIDLWILRYLSLCLFVASVVTLVVCLILVWGLYSAHVLLFIASTMICFIIIGEFTISILTFTSKYEIRVTLLEQLPKLGTDERAKRALDKLQSTFRCCGADGRLSYQNNVPLSCNMYSIGCLTRTMFFLDSWMDALAYILLFFSLIKLLVVLLFYAYLCSYQRRKQKYSKNNRNLMHDSSVWRRSSSMDSLSGDNLAKKALMTKSINNDNKNTNNNNNNNNNNNHENDYVEKRSAVPNDYEISSNQRMQQTILLLPTMPSSTNHSNNALAVTYEPYGSRKLSSISEKTEKSETDDSEPDIARLKHIASQRKAIITSVNPKHYLSPIKKQLPIVKSRKKLIRDDGNDSGVERSSSEKSFEDQSNLQKILTNVSSATTTTNMPSQSTSANNKSPNLLGFSNVFITSVSQSATQQDEIQKPLTKSPILFDRSSPNDVVIPKPILKKSSPHSSPDRILIDFRDQKNSSSTYKNTSLLNYIPKPIPRSTLKQLKQDESLV